MYLVILFSGSIFSFLRKLYHIYFPNEIDKPRHVLSKKEIKMVLKRSVKCQLYFEVKFQEDFLIIVSQRTFLTTDFKVRLMK